VSLQIASALPQHHPTLPPSVCTIAAMDDFTTMNEVMGCVSDGVNRVANGLDRVSEKLRDILGVLDEML
jgi:hypothetical protein